MRILLVTAIAFFLISVLLLVEVLARDNAEVKSFPVVDGKTYWYQSYRCEFGVLYANLLHTMNRMTDINGNAIPCTSVEITINDFRKIHNRDKRH